MTKDNKINVRIRLKDGMNVDRFCHMIDFDGVDYFCQGKIKRNNGTYTIELIEPPTNYRGIMEKYCEIL